MILFCCSENANFCAQWVKKFGRIEFWSVNTIDRTLRAKTRQNFWAKTPRTTVYKTTSYKKYNISTLELKFKYEPYLLWFFSYIDSIRSLTFKVFIFFFRDKICWRLTIFMLPHLKYMCKLNVKNVQKLSHQKCSAGLRL